MVVGCASAGAQPPAPGSESTQSVTHAETPASDTAGPVILPEPTPEAVRYYKTGIALWLFNRFWELLIPGILIFTGFSARIRDLARRWGRWWYFTIVLYWILFLLLNYVIDWPLSFYAGFVRQHAYGMSNQTFGKWLGDSVIEVGVTAAFGAAFLWVPYLLLKKSPRRWWLYTGLLMYPFLAFILLIKPIWVDPLYNDFGPMKDKALESKILQLADSAGIEGSRVYEVDMSVDTKALNAYVTGFHHTKRIVLWDTIIAALNEKELLFVMAHEMGHYVLGHVVKGILFFGTLILLGLGCAHVLAMRMIRRFGNRFRFHELADIASVPLLMFVFYLITLVFDPIGLAYSRHMEHEADRFALELTQDNHDAAEAFVKLYSENLGYPDPGLLVTLWRSSHPSIADRVAFCNTYHPWETGGPLEYGSLFHRRPEAEVQNP